jgi:hypothetical protein
VKVQRLWRTTPITTSFDAANYSPGRRPTLTINGKTLVGNTIPSALVSDLRDNGRRGFEVEVDWPAPNRSDFAAAAVPRAAPSNVGGELGALRSKGS